MHLKVYTTNDQMIDLPTLQISEKGLCEIMTFCLKKKKFWFVTCSNKTFVINPTEIVFMTIEKEEEKK